MATHDEITKERADRLAALGFLTGQLPDQDSFFAGSGRYVLLHFDLMTKSDKNQAVDRGGVYTKLAQLSMLHLGGSVYTIPIPDEDTAEAFAITTWNDLLRVTKGDLRFGDIFFLHYSDTVKNRISVIAQMVPKGQTALAYISPTPKTP